MSNYVPNINLYIIDSIVKQNCLKEIHLKIII